MIPLEKVKQIVSTYETLETELASGNIDKKDFVKKSKEYSSIGEVINEARSYIGFEKEKEELEKIIDEKNNDKLKQHLICHLKNLIKVSHYLLFQAEQVHLLVFQLCQQHTSYNVIYQ